MEIRFLQSMPQLMKNLNYLTPCRDSLVQMFQQGEAGVEFQNVKFEKVYEIPK